MPKRSNAPKVRGRAAEGDNGTSFGRLDSAVASPIQAQDYEQGFASGEMGFTDKFALQKS